ncbi:MAG: hypothetical protein KC505_01120 [Myxococcales bacterium]|nr:hypothetical protein [Myxococcales bacterium]USN50837.1 MAG: hypothetical protein H6731_11400 [Myxococcales bacterium]
MKLYSHLLCIFTLLIYGESIFALKKIGEISIIKKKIVYDTGELPEQVDNFFECIEPIGKKKKRKKRRKLKYLKQAQKYETLIKHPVYYSKSYRKLSNDNKIKIDKALQKFPCKKSKQQQCYRNLKKGKSSIIFMLSYDECQILAFCFLSPKNSLLNTLWIDETILHQLTFFRFKKLCNMIAKKLDEESVIAFTTNKAQIFYNLLKGHDFGVFTSYFHRGDECIYYELRKEDITLAAHQKKPHKNERFLLNP